MVWPKSGTSPTDSPFECLVKGWYLVGEAWNPQSIVPGGWKQGTRGGPLKVIPDPILSHTLFPAHPRQEQHPPCTPATAPRPPCLMSSWPAVQTLLLSWRCALGKVTLRVFLFESDRLWVSPLLIPVFTVGSFQAYLLHFI